MAISVEMPKSERTALTSFESGDLWTNRMFSGLVSLCTSKIHTKVQDA